MRMIDVALESLDVLTEYNRFRMKYQVNNELLRFRYIINIFPININPTLLSHGRACAEVAQSESGSVASRPSLSFSAPRSAPTPNYLLQ